MPTIQTDGWLLGPPESRFIDARPVRLPIFARRYNAPNSSYWLVFPQGRLSPDLWKCWIQCCQHNASFDVANKAWIWSNASLERLSSPNEASKPSDNPMSLTKAEREALKAARKAQEEKFNADLLELSKAENVPEELWNNYSYPSHYRPRPDAAVPTALQRIVVNRYWCRPFAIIAASVGTGKSRMTVDILSARALAPSDLPNSSALRDSARITLIVAPLSLHENWKREFSKWAPSTVEWQPLKFAPTKEFWEDAERAATRMFDGPVLRTGGLAIIVTPNALSRQTFSAQLKTRGWVPTAIVVDECQRFFRKPDNKAFKHLTAIREKAHLFIGLSGTPTSKFEDWWALEELMSGRASNQVHWKQGTFLDYQRLGDRETMTQSGLHERGWSFERGIKEWHKNRITASHIFSADKFYYMKDALPGLGQEELGEFADLRLGFGALTEKYPEHTLTAIKLQAELSGNAKFKGSETFFATTIMLRMRQIAAMSAANQVLLEQFVEDTLDENEPAVIWVEFVNDPHNQLDKTVDYLNTVGPTCYIKGGMDNAMRQEAIDGFQAGRYRFIVCQLEAAGVGITLTRACKSLFQTTPLGYQSVAQAIGRLHRIGQTSDVMSYFSMGHPITCFARYIYDNRVELNEAIPRQLSGIFATAVKEMVDAPPALN